MSKRIVFFAMIFVLLVAITACCKNMGNHNHSANRTYELSGNASGAQVQPPTGSTGTASIAGTYNANTNLLNYQITWSNLLSAAVSGGFHSKTGDQHTNTGIAWSFSGNNSAPSGNHYGMVTLTAEQETQLLANQFSYVINTTHYAEGEIRGQVTATLRQ